MQELIIPAIGVINDVFDQYTELPFGLEAETFINYAFGQFQKRLERIERARSLKLEQVMGAESHDLEQAEVIES